MRDVLAGIRVLDFRRYIAGPYCAALLADLGADVIRIERIGGEDRWVAPINDDGIGALYVTMNRNKRGMTLDPSSPDGRGIVKKLVATAYGARVQQRRARRAAGDPGQSHPDREPRADVGAVGSVSHEGRLDHRVRHRQSDVRALGEDDGRGQLALGSALQG